MSEHAAPDRMLDLEGARLRWRLEGTGPALALLHGWPLDLEYWDPVVPMLARQFTVLRADRRGFGLSAGTPDIHRNVADLEAVLDAAEIPEVVLVGMSQGARLALHFAARHAARVRGLVLDGPPAVDAEPELPMQQYREILESRGVAALRSEILRHPLMRLQRDAPRGLLHAVLGRYSGLDLVHRVARALPPDLSRITMPTLIINGSQDDAARLDAARLLQASIPQARCEQLPGAGHLTVLDDPGGYAAAVISFCSDLRA